MALTEVGILRARYIMSQMDYMGSYSSILNTHKDIIKSQNFIGDYFMMAIDLGHYTYNQINNDNGYSILKEVVDRHMKKYGELVTDDVYDELGLMEDWGFWSDKEFYNLHHYH